MDPRTERSRVALRDALVDLIRERDYADISIQDITDRADTARVTFYRHYANKEELLLDFLATLYAQFAAQLEPDEDRVRTDFTQAPPTLNVFEFVAADKPLYQRLMNGPIAPMLERQMRVYIAEQITAVGTALTDIETHFMASAFIGNLKWWLAEEPPYSATAMAKMTHWLAVSGVMAMRGTPGAVTMPDDAARAGTPYA